MARATSFTFTWSGIHAGAELLWGEQRWPEDHEDSPRDLHQHSSCGRTTAQGRKMEKPGSGNQAGPSGQRDRTRHDRQHANR